MDMDKYNRSISLLCPTCGNDQFQHEQEMADDFATAICTSCGRVVTRHELIRENSENINVHMDEVKQQVKKDIAREVRSSLRKVFRGSKNIRIE